MFVVVSEVYGHCFCVDGRKCELLMENNATAAAASVAHWPRTYIHRQYRHRQKQGVSRRNICKGKDKDKADKQSMKKVEKLELTQGTNLCI